MELELSCIFWVNVVTKNIVLGLLDTFFMYMRVKHPGASLTFNLPYLAPIWGEQLLKCDYLENSLY